MGFYVHIFSKDYTICIKDKLGSLAILSLEGDLRAEKSSKVGLWPRFRKKGFGFFIKLVLTYGHQTKGI